MKIKLKNGHEWKVPRVEIYDKGVYGITADEREFIVFVPMHNVEMIDYTDKDVSEPYQLSK